ncbi:MAG TPA: alpha/beta hydrolase [Allosphingosinicella sp.]|nr:alpha/beta hydrolase [Allosphingosinicella sp.]
MSLLAALALLAAPPAILPRDCPAPLAAAQARCGTVSVAEDRARPDGRRIALNMVILPSVGPVRHPPLVSLEGGPGLPAVPGAVFYLTDGAAYRAGRDIVLFDQRGTGQSNPLDCPDLTAPDIQYLLAYPVDRVRACREALSGRADLRHYGTDTAAADLDEVRRALGAERIDIVALSYGTLLAQRYMTLYPGRTRAAVLFGVAPPEARPPRSHAPAAQAAFDQLFAACAAAPACAGLVRDWRATLASALARLPADLPGEVFTEKLRSLAYAPTGARAIPLILSRAAAGDFGPFYARTRRSGPLPDAEGMYLSITCSEGLAAMDVGEAAAASRATVFGDYRLRRQQAACAEWPLYEVASGFFTPAAPDAALLIVSGELDPVTPPAWAEALARRAPRARHLVLPGSGHVFDGMSGIDTCLDPLVVRFLDSGDVAALDAGCVAAMRPPAFATE